MNNFNKMIEKVKKIKQGMGAQALLNEAYKILGNPIAMNNTEYTLQAHVDVETDDPLWSELISLGTFCQATQQFFEKAGFVEEVANNRIAYLKTEYLKYDRINGKLYNKNNTHVSNLIIIAANKPFEEGDKEIFEIICKLMSKEISQNEEIARYEQEHQEWLINNLTSGNVDGKRDVAQVEILYGALEENLYVAVADVSSSGKDAVVIRDLFRSVKPEYKYAIYSGYVIIIISTNEESLNVCKELKELIKAFKENNISAGLSGKFENLFDLKRHYEEALKMLNYVLKCPCSQRIFPINPKSVEIMQKIEKVENGKGVQYLLDVGTSIFINPLLFHDLELNLLAYSAKKEIKDSIWQEIITYGTASNDTVKLFKDNGFVATMENTKGGALLVDEKIKYDRISWKIYSCENIMIGCLSIVNTDIPFASDLLILFGTFSQKLSREIGSMDFYCEYGQIYSEAVINKLISGKMKDHAFYTESINNIYSKLMENIYLMIIDTSQYKGEKICLSQIRDLLDWKQAVNRYAINSDYIIAIISINDTIDQRKNQLINAEAFFKDRNIYACISQCFKNINDLLKHYLQAVNKLKSKKGNLAPDQKHLIFSD